MSTAMSAAASRTERRRDATKRQILNALDDASSSSSCSNHKPAEYLVSHLDGTNASHIQGLIQDLSEKVSRQQNVLVSEAATGKKEQLGTHVIHMMKLSSRVKKMTVREFNQEYKCNLLESIMTTVNTAGGKKRIRPITTTTTTTAAASTTELETPAPHRLAKAAQATPSRTVKRGEQVFSKNGSPVDTHDEGTLVATVSKKQKRGAVFDINVGQGRYISLTEPGTIECLDGEMKHAAISQIKILQDQMASLMDKLHN